MQKLYIAEAKKIQTKTGKTYLEVIDGAGSKYSCWEEDDFADLIPGAEVEIDLIVKGNFKNIKVAGKQRTSTYRREDKIAVAQQRKAEYVGQAQDKKDEMIAWYNSTNAAIELGKVIGFPADNDIIKKMIQYWRNWFMKEWQDKPPFV